MNGEGPQGEETPPAAPTGDEVPGMPLPDFAITPPPLPAPTPSPRPADPWAHRRGEPRVFAFCWTIYVLIAVAGSVLWVARFASVSAGSYGPAARIMLVVVSIGATILWPMVRLSQASPRGSPLGHVLADVFVVLMPIQFVLWPLMVLANWPLMIVAGVAAMIAAWVALSSGLLALGLAGTPAHEPGGPKLIERSFWMAMIVAAVGMGPLLSLLLTLARRPGPAWLPMLSPLTGIPALTGAGISGPQAPINTGQWESIGLVAAAGLAAWIVAAVRMGLGKGRPVA